MAGGDSLRLLSRPLPDPGDRTPGVNRGPGIAYGATRRKPARRSFFPTEVSVLLTLAAVRRLVGAAVATAFLLLACSDRITDANDLDPVPETACANTAVASPTTPALAFERITDEVHRPTALAFAPGQDRFHVTQQWDGVRVVESDGSVHPLMFIDKRGQTSTDIEQGVLGIVFDPGFQENGFL